MMNEQYRIVLARHGLGEPDGAILLRLLGRKSSNGCRFADLSGMFGLLPEILRCLEHGKFIIRRDGRIFLTGTGEDVARDLFRSVVGERLVPPGRFLPEDAAARRTDENLRSVFG